MVQPKIQAAQNAALGSQKLDLGKGASTQEAEGGRLWIWEKGVGGVLDSGCYSLPWVRFCPHPGPQFSVL